jgi:hypothetical protein
MQRIMLKTYFIIILNSEVTRCEWTDQMAFIEANLKEHKFGEIARMSGEAPIKAVFTFKTNIIQGIRGDKYTGKPIEMVRKLYKLSRKYWEDKKISEMKIYDNRNLLPVENSPILHWSEKQGVLINLLPFYSGDFDINLKQYPVQKTISMNK